MRAPGLPDCLRSAPVGQQCVECIKQGNRGVRQPTAVFGGRARLRGPVTCTLVGLNVLLYLVEWVYPRIVDYFDMVGRPTTRPSTSWSASPTGQ